MTVVSGTEISLVQGDITKESTGAIVNAANAHLAGGGGVDGAIHRAGGPSIKKETNEKYDGCPTGGAVITGGGNLKADYVIHAVGPIYRDGRRGEAELLAGAYKGCLDLAVENKVRTIAFPSISTGAYGYPVREAAEVALKTVADFIKENEGKLDLVRFCFFSEGDLAVYEEALSTVIE